MIIFIKNYYPFFHITESVYNRFQVAVKLYDNTISRRTINIKHAQVQHSQSYCSLTKTDRFSNIRNYSGGHRNFNNRYKHFDCKRYL